MLTRFIVLAAPRCGSNWLCSMLDSHPAILCHHELFNPEGIHIALSLRDKDWSADCISKGKQAALELLADTWRETHGFEAVGFKLNLGQNVDIFDAVLRDKSIRKLIIRRCNRIRSFLSEQIAEQSGVWESYPNSEAPEPMVPQEINLENLKHNIRRNQLYYNEIEDKLKKLDQHWLSVEYEALADAQIHQSILTYLGVDPGVRLQGATRKVNHGALIDLISNFNELGNELKGSELESDLFSRDYRDSK